MSDLAPFVAAALRDKVVAELLEENQRLKGQVKSFQRVRITGKNGFPIYAQQDFTTGKPTDHGWWVVRLPALPKQKYDNSNDSVPETQQEPQQQEAPHTSVPCPMSLLSECEIHVGNFRNMACRDFNDCFFDGNPKGYFSLFATKGLWLCCYLQDVSDPQYRSLCRAAAQVDNVQELLVQNFEEPMMGQDLNVYFTHLTFCGGSATEAIRHLDLY